MSSKRKHEEDDLGATTKVREHNVPENIDGSTNPVSEIPDLSIDILQGIYNALTAATLVQQPLLECKYLIDLR
jgi:hypothetical protein